MSEKLSVEELLRHVPIAEWVRDMQDHFAETGGFRPEDLERVLGDRSRGVEMSEEPDCLTSFKIC